MAATTPSIPRIAITMGDPAGVGPELCCQLLNDQAVLDVCVPVIFGNVQILRLAAERCGYSFQAQTVDASNPETLLSVQSPAVFDMGGTDICLLYTSPSPRDLSTSRMPSSA